MKHINNKKHRDMEDFTYNDYLRGLSDDKLDKELWKNRETASYYDLRDHLYERRQIEEEIENRNKNDYDSPTFALFGEY